MGVEELRGILDEVSGWGFKQVPNISSICEIEMDLGGICFLSPIKKCSLLNGDITSICCDVGIKKTGEKYIAKTFYPHCKRIVKTAKERTVSGKEFGLLYQRFEADYRKKPNYIPTYAVQFASLTGFRVSEISALMWTDIQNGSIKVDKSEKYNRATKEYWIGKTKNEKIRYMPLTDEIIALLYRLRTIQIEYDYLGDYIFQNEEGRIHAPTISACAKNKCIQLGIPVKSIHSYRRTFSSRLKCRGISSTVVSALLGHTEEVNEQYYTYDVTDIEEKKLMVGMITKEIASSQFVAPNCGIEGQYVLSNGKGNQR